MGGGSDDGTAAGVTAVRALTRAGSSGGTGRAVVSPGQFRILRGLARNGGLCAHRRLAPVCYGVRFDVMSLDERKSMNASVRGLERRGLLTIARNWRTWGYGQPELVQLTARGTEIVGN